MYVGYVFATGTMVVTHLDASAEPCLTPVTPIKPFLSPTLQCGVEDTVFIPTTAGVLYTQTRNGQIVTVVATAEAGFVLADGAVSTWTFTLAEIEPCGTPTSPFIPNLVPAEQCGIEATVSTQASPGVIYTQTREGNIVTVTASLEDGYIWVPGVPTVWTFEIPAVEPCPPETVDVTPIAPMFAAQPVCGVEQTLFIPEQEGVLFTETRDGNTVTVTATALEGFVLADGAVASWTFEIPAVVPCVADDVPVTPASPSIDQSEVCGEPNTLVIPVTEGVIYAVGEPDENGSMTVTASTEPGFVFTEGSVIGWEVNLGTVADCPTGPEEPTDPVVTPTDVVKVAVAGEAMNSTSSTALLAGLGALLLAGAAGVIVLLRRRARS